MISDLFSFKITKKKLYLNNGWCGYGEKCRYKHVKRRKGVNISFDWYNIGMNQTYNSLLYESDD